MSELKVNKISPETGTAITLGDSGDTFTVPSGATIVNSGTATGFGGGKVLQVVSTVKTDTFQSTANSFTDVTGMSVSITPSSGTKVLVVVTAQIAHRSTYAGYARIVRDSTAIGVGDSAGSRGQATFGLFSGGDNYEVPSYAMNYLDTHGANGSTAVTYKLQFNSAGNSGELSLNRSYSDTDSVAHGRYASTITVMEIGA